MVTQKFKYLVYLAFCFFANYDCFSQESINNFYLNFNESKHSIGDKFIIFDKRDECNLLSMNMDLSSEYYRVFDTLNFFFNKNNNYIFEIGVYSDCRGDEKYNIELCDKISNYIKNYFVAKYFYLDLMFVIKAYGSSLPYITNKKNSIFPSGTVLDCNYIRSIGVKIHSNSLKSCIENKKLSAKCKMALRYNRRVEIKIIGIKNYK